MTLSILLLVATSRLIEIFQSIQTKRVQNACMPTFEIYPEKSK